MSAAEQLTVRIDDVETVDNAYFKSPAWLKRGIDREVIVLLTLCGMVKTIGGEAFRSCKGLTSLTLGASVVLIEQYAFYGCTGLASLVIPDSVVSIGGQAFHFCKGLTSLVIPDSVKTIGAQAFFLCNGLTSVVVPYGCTVHPRAFPPGCKVTVAPAAAAEASGAVSSAPAPAASQTSSVTTGGSGASDASAPLALERETDTLLDVYFPPMDKTYRGVVVETFEKYGVDGVIVLYSDGELWHDFGTHDQNCTFTVIEPPIQALEWIRRTANGFQGKLPHPQHGTIWDLIPANVKNHFHDPEANEGAWLDALTIADGFQRLPSGKKKKKVAAPAKKPDCVPGGLELGFAAAGDAEASAIVAEHEDAIIAAEGRKGDRIKYAAIDVVKPLCHYDARSIKVDCALAVDPAYVSVLRLKSKNGTTRTHSVTIFNGLIFDSVEEDPLPLTVENLTHCLGAPYGGIIKKNSYYFVKQVSQKRPLGVSASPNASPVAKKARKA